MFKIRIVGKDSEKEIRLNEEGLKGFVSPFVVQQAKVMGFAKTTIINGKEISTGTGKNKQLAEQQAAKKALKLI